MNLLDPNRAELRKQYVIDTMRKNNFCNIVPEKGNTILQKITKKNVFFTLISLFTVVGLVVTLVANPQSFVVNANQGEVYDGEVLGESTALSPSPLVPKVRKSATSSYQLGDKRYLALKKFLERKGSPMAEYADVFIAAADENGMDWTLVASISGAESDFGKKTTRKVDGGAGSTYNFAGWFKGWTNGGRLPANPNRFQEFASWEDSIRGITRGIAKGYGQDVNPFRIQDTYCFSCRGTNKWATIVTNNMNEIKRLETNLN